jgi:integrase
LESLRPPRVKDNRHEHQYVSLEEVQKLLAVKVDESDLALLRNKDGAA